MGNSASQLPYSIDNQVGAPHDHNGWALHNGKSTDGTQKAVSVFVGKKPNLAKQAVSPRFPNMTQLEPALHHYNNCRKLRHPQILKVYATLDTDNPTAASTEGGPATAASSDSSSKTKTGDLIVVTEPCISLDQWLLQNPTPEQLAWGLECVVKGLHFLHFSAKLSHGNISPSSFYVTQSGDVKLWNFSLVTPVGPNLLTNHFQQWEQACTPDNYRSPERVERRWDAISNGGVHSMDSYALGILIDHWYRGSCPAPLQKAVQRLMTPNIKMRPRLQPLLKCPVFDTPYQKIQIELEEIAIQPIEQKVTLWQHIETIMQHGGLPKDVAIYKVLPLIQSHITTTCTNEAMLSQDLYRREVLAMVQPLFYIVENFLDPSSISGELGPLVELLFKVKDRGVRGALLNKVKFMSQHLDKRTLNASVFEPLCTGFNDSSPALREMTLKATLGLVPSLNEPNVEKLSRYLVRLQGDSETSIRTNAVIFFAKLAPKLSEVSREKMLLQAYARAMKDTFPPCRLSGLQSVLKSKELFATRELAVSVLPAVMPLTLDPMAHVRQEAFKVVNDFMITLKQESDRLETLAQQEAARQAQQQQLQQPVGAPGGPIPAAPIPPAPSSTNSGYLSGLSSWVSSSTKAPEQSPTSAPAQVTSPHAAMAAPPPAAPVPTPPVQQFASATISSPALAAAPIADDGWDDADDDGWGDDVEVEEDPFANIGTKTKPTTTPSPSQSRSFSNPNQFNNFSSPMDDDPFAAIGMKAPTLSTKSSGGKLVLPKKGGLTLKPKAAAPATKLAVDSSEMADGWDDF